VLPAGGAAHNRTDHFFASQPADKISTGATSNKPDTAI